MTAHRMNTRATVIQDDARAIAEVLGKRAVELEGARLLVTGAGGFLPAYIVHAVGWLNNNVLTRPCRVFALLRQAPSTGSRLEPWIGDPNIEFLIQDAATPVLSEVAADYIVHGASPASPSGYLARPFDAIDANVWGTRLLLERAREWKSRSFVFFSSSEPYGNPPSDQIPTPETYVGQVDPLGVRAVYTETKRMGETLCATFARQHGVPVKIVRPFHTYGPGVQLDDGRIMGEFLGRRLQGSAIEAKSDGSGVRSFCYVGDATAGYLLALLSNHNGHAFNIGDDREPVTMRQLAEMIAGIESPRLDVRFGLSPTAAHLSGTPDRVQPDLRKAKDLLGYVPRVDLSEGIGRTLRSFRAG